MIFSEYSPSTWRLLKTPPERGAWNMAVDEAILEAVSEGKSPPTLRLFAWDPPCLSIGYAQPFSDIDTNRLFRNGWELVRRVTGGRAILHTDELTYSVIAPENDPRVAGNVLESYKRLSQALLAALVRLGLPAESLPYPPKNGESIQQQEPVCFEIPSNYEITVGGKKLIGSAQARKKKVVLQHGTLPLYGDLTRITHVLYYPDETSRLKAAARLLNRATTLETVSEHPIPWETAASAFIESFSQALNLTLSEGTLSPEEVARAKVLVKEKYAHPDWNERI